MPLAAELLSFFCDYELEQFMGVRARLAEAVFRWSTDRDGELYEAEQGTGSATRSIRAKQCIYLASALLCHQRGHLGDGDFARIL